MFVSASQRCALLLAVCSASSLNTFAQTYPEKIKAARERIDATAAAGPYRADWKSLETYQVPEWYLDAKFGIFIHWGLYSVPAFGNEWYPRNMYIPGSEVVQTSRRDLRSASQVRLQGLHPQVHRREVRRQPLGRALPEGRGQIRRAGGRASRRLPDVRLQLLGVERREDGSEARHRRRARRRRPRARPRLWTLVPPRRALVVLSTAA